MAALVSDQPAVVVALPLPRFSTFCSAARGAAAANPRRDERIMVECMAMRTCAILSGKITFGGRYRSTVDSCGNEVRLLNE